nr:MAG: hypothetical protein DIU66_03875 [Bacillota bacterium]
MHRLNLIPEEYFKSRRKRIIKLLLFFSGVAVLVLTFHSILKYNALLLELNDEIQELDRSISFYRSSLGHEKDAEKLYADLKARTKIIDNLQKDRMIISDCLKKIFETPPPGTSLTSVDIYGTKGVIRGFSSEYSSIIFLVNKLEENNDEFYKVELGSIKRESGKNFYTFEIMVYMRGNDLIEYQVDPT